MVVGDDLVHKILISDANKSLALLKPGQTLKPAPEKGTIFESVPPGSWDTDQGVPRCYSCTSFSRKNQILKLDA